MICSNDCRFYTLKYNAHSRHELHYYNEFQPKNKYYYINIMTIDIPNASCHTTSLQQCPRPMNSMCINTIVYNLPNLGCYVASLQQHPWTMNLMHIITMMFDLPNIGVPLHCCNNAHNKYISTIRN
jgi:hypothetical protein